jgi:Delta3-Delta2-enoyl-CoA isomerase
VFTVAAINGHAFGAGAQLAVAHDLRLMRSEKGFWCMPEIDMGVPLHPGMAAVLQARIPRQTVHQLIVTGKRYGAEEAVAARIVDRAVPEATLVPDAIAAATAMAAKACPAMGRLKRGLYAEVLAAMATMPADLFS